MLIHLPPYLEAMGVLGVAEDVSRRTREIDVKEPPQEVIDSVWIIVHPAPQLLNRLFRYRSLLLSLCPLQHVVHDKAF